MNDTDTIIKYLKLYNEWRRGDEKMGQPNPTEIGKLIDEACEKLSLLERERDEAREQLKEARKHLKDANRGAERNAIVSNIQAGKLVELRKERDKLENDFDSMKRERDEARREVDRFREEKDLLPISWDT